MPSNVIMDQLPSCTDPNVYGKEPDKRHPNVTAIYYLCTKFWYLNINTDFADSLILLLNM